MSDPIFPFAVWQSGTNQNSIPANDNALRAEILSGLVISESTDAQPGSPARGDIYIMTGAASGTQWATFDEFDLAIFDGAGTWHAYAPIEGIVVNVAGTLKRWNGSAYVNIATTADTLDLVTEASAFTAVAATHAGTQRLVLAAGNVTFDNAETYSAGQAFNILATSALDLIEDGVTLTPPAGGTLALDANMAVTVVMTGATTGRVIGQTVAA